MPSRSAPAGRSVRWRWRLLNGAPSVDEALAGISQPIIRVVPFFMEDGYFSRVAVPRAIGAATSSDAGHRAGSFCVPRSGVHDGMAGLIERQALAACADCAIALAHRRGSGRRPWVRQCARAERWRCIGTRPVSPRRTCSLGWKRPAWRKPRSSPMRWRAACSSGRGDRLLRQPGRPCPRRRAGPDRGGAGQPGRRGARWCDLTALSPTTRRWCRSFWIRRTERGRIRCLPMSAGTPPRTGTDAATASTSIGVDPVNGGWSHIQHVGGLENPSLFTLNRDGTRLYCVHGGRT